MVHFGHQQLIDEEEELEPGVRMRQLRDNLSVPYLPVDVRDAIRSVTIGPKAHVEPDLEAILNRASQAGVTIEKSNRELQLHDRQDVAVAGAEGSVDRGAGHPE